MIIYYIYHIPTYKWKNGRIGKIGCTKNPKVRITENQGYSDYEILEEHTDIMIASKREIELQKHYGYPLDKTPYFVSCERIEKARTIENCIKGGIAVKNNGHIKKITKIAIEKNKKPILQYSKEGDLIKEWPYINQASNELKILAQNICRAARGNRKSAGGYVWKYIRE